MRWTAEQLAKHQARRQSMSAPPAPIGRRRPRSRPRPDASELQVHEAVVAHLRTRGRRGIHWRHPATGEHRDPAIGAKLKRMGVRAGLPDLLLLIDGRLHGLELKRERGGRVNADQRAMHNELRGADAVVETARGVDEAVLILEQWGAFLPSNRKDDAA